MRWAGLPNLKMVRNYNKMTDEIVIWPSHTLWHEKETIAQVYKRKFLKLDLVFFSEIQSFLLLCFLAFFSFFAWNFNSTSSRFFAVINFLSSSAFIMRCSSACSESPSRLCALTSLMVRIISSRFWFVGLTVVDAGAWAAGIVASESESVEFTTLDGWGSWDEGASVALLFSRVLGVDVLVDWKAACGGDW